MKRNLLFLGLAVSCLASCGGDTPLQDLQGLAFTSKSGEVSWTALSGADAYAYYADASDKKTTNETAINIFDVVKDVNATSLTVEALSNNKVIGKGELTFETAKLATPNKPVLGEDETTHEPILTWNEVPSAYRYMVSINGGSFTSYVTNVYKPFSKGSYSINVKCREWTDMTQGKVYLESGVSETSDTLYYIPGPSLSVIALNQIAWESADEFDSYNLWVDGVKVRDNVVSPIDLAAGDDPILTKTGEYDIQIEAIKGGQSFWSNTQEQVGTSNINYHEIYSFDNRKFNHVVPSQTDPGWTVTDEKSHSEPCSLYIPKQHQVNLVRYDGSGINAVDYRKISTLSYWCYIPEIAGYSGTTVKNTNIPCIVYDGWGASAPHARNVSWAKEAEIPVGEWTKVTFDVENQYENIIIFSAGAALTLDDGVSSVSVPLYIDDITYDDVDDDSLEYDYRFTYSRSLCGGAWANKAITIPFGEEYAKKTVDVTMDLCGTASPTGVPNLGLGAYSFNEEKSEWALSGQGEVIDRSLISSLNFQEYKTRWKLDEKGNYHTNACCWQEGEGNVAEKFTMYAKNLRATIAVIDKDFSDGTKVVLKDNTSGEYAGVIALPVEQEVGTILNVKMKVGYVGQNNATIDSVHGFWPTEPAVSARGTSILTDPTALRLAKTWTDIECMAPVVDASSVNLKGTGNTGATFELSGRYVLLTVRDAGDGDEFYYMDPVVTELENGCAMTRGDVNVSSASAGTRYQSYATLPVEGVSEGDDIHVSMDIQINDLIDQYTSLVAADKSTIAWGGGTYLDGLNRVALLDFAKASEIGHAIQHVEFDTKAYSYTSMRANSSFEEVDISGSGVCALVALTAFTVSSAPLPHAAYINHVVIQKR